MSPTASALCTTRSPLSECPPVLLLVCDRPELTRRVLDRIRSARPRELYVGADGPRTDDDDARRRWQAARAAAVAVDWDCAVRTLERERNLGCRHAISSAITWFFEHVEEGIILEDDCVPEPTFFRYCAELLERYREDERLMGIGGNNFRAPRRPRDESYTFSAYPQIWGWATWRRAWASYDDGLSLWPRLRETDWLERFMSDRAAARFWRSVFDRDHAGHIDTWDFAWTFACWVEHGLTAHPALNLVSNVGFGDAATHTSYAASPLAAVPSTPMAFPLVHPQALVRDYDADRFTAEHVHQVRLRTSRWRRALVRARRTRLTRLRRAGHRLLRTSRGGIRVGAP